MKNKIIIFLPSLTKGGGEVQCLRLMENYDSKKDLEIIYINEGELSKQFSESGIKLTKLNKEYLGKNKFISFIDSLYTFNREISKKSPKIIYSWFQVANIITAIIKLFNKHNFIFISSVRYGSIPITKKLKTKLGLFILGFAYKISDIIIANSKAGQKAVLDFYNIDINKIVLINNSISKIKFKNKITNDKYHLTFVGRLHKYKNPLMLLKAVSLIKNKNDYIIHYKGIEDGIAKESLFEYANKYKINLKYYGFCSDPYDTVYSNQILISCSNIEGVSNTILEAMSLGIPVIATNVGDNKYLLGNGRGILVPINDHVSMAKKIEYLISNITLFDATKSYKYVNKNYSIDMSVNLHKKLFNK